MLCIAVMSLAASVRQAAQFTGSRLVPTPSTQFRLYLTSLAGDNNCWLAFGAYTFATTQRRRVRVAAVRGAAAGRFPGANWSMVCIAVMSRGGQRASGEQVRAMRFVCSRLVPTPSPQYRL